MNEVQKFEKEKLHGKCSIEQFEEKYLQAAVWQYYKEKITVKQGIDILDEKIKSRGFVVKRMYLSGSKSFLEGVLSDMMDPKIEFNCIEEMINNRPQDVKKLQDLIVDKNMKMIAASSLLSRYCKARNITPEDLLMQYTFEQYLEEVGDEKLKIKYGELFGSKGGRKK